MNNWIQAKLIIEIHQKEIDQFVEEQRLIKAASANQPHRPGRSDRFLAWLGDRLEQTGQKMKERHSVVMDSGSPQESRSSVI